MNNKNQAAVAEVFDLTFTGQPEAAIARASALLAAGRLTPLQQAELLDLRGENHLNRGENDRCGDDVRALQALAAQEVIQQEHVGLAGQSLSQRHALTAASPSMPERRQWQRRSCSSSANAFASW